MKYNLFHTKVTNEFHTGEVYRVAKYDGPMQYEILLHKTIRNMSDFGCDSLLTVPLMGYCNRKIVSCLFLKTIIRIALS